MASSSGINDRLPPMAMPTNPSHSLVSFREYIKRSQASVRFKIPLLSQFRKSISETLPRARLLSLFRVSKIPFLTPAHRTTTLVHRPVHNPGNPRISALCAFPGCSISTTSLDFIWGPVVLFGIPILHHFGVQITKAFSSLWSSFRSASPQRSARRTTSTVVSMASTVLPDKTAHLAYPPELGT